jgi:signal transduction histidine kinase/DNA-binding response OmpR family regulator
MLKANFSDIVKQLSLAVVEIQQYLISHQSENINFHLILSTIGSSIRVAYGAVFLLEGKLPDLPHRVPLSSWGEPRETESLLAKIDFYYDRLLNEETILVEDHILLLPIGVEGTLWGTILWDSSAWEEEQIKILESLAHTIGADLTRRARELDTNASLQREIKLFEITRRLRQSLQTEQILATAVTEIRGLYQCDRVLIYRLGGSKGNYLLQHSSKDVIPNQNISINVANFGFNFGGVEQNLRPRIVDDIDRAGLSPSILKLFHRTKVKAFLSVPIPIEGEVWGWLVLHYCNLPHYWSTSEVYTVKHLAEQLGVAIHQADLYETTCKQQQRDYILNRISSVIRTFTDLPTILKSVAQEICQLCATQEVIFWHYDRAIEDWRILVHYDCLGGECQNPSSQSNAPRKFQLNPWQEDSIWGFPLVLRSELWGTMEVKQIPEQTIDRDLLELIVNQLVVVIQRYQLLRYKELQNAREQAFNRLMRQLLAGSSLNDFFVYAVTELQHGLRADQIYIGRCLRENTWNLQWGYLSDGGKIECLEIELDGVRPDISSALTRGEILHLDYVHSLAPNFNVELGALYLPLQFQHRVWGCLIIVKGKKRWLVEELQLAEGIADIVAIAIYQQELRESEQKQRQELSLQNLHLEATLQAAETAKAAQNRFLANMSHEIRTPMNGVIGMAELLAETELTPQQQQFVETIGVCGRNLLHLINDILDLSKLEAGQTQLESMPFRIQTCVEEACHLIAVQCHQKNIEVFPYLDPNLPQAVEGDPTRLQQVLNNLASNAAKFTDRGAIHIRATLLAWEGEEAIVSFTVQDSGIGIRAEDISRLFKPFQQVDASTTRRYGGTGLGLSICQQLVELMGGRISLKSEFGKGSEFTFSLPFSVVSQTSPPPANLEGMKVLVVCDQPATAKVIESYTQPWNIDLECVRDGTFALERLRSKSYDRIFLDMQMSPISGKILAQYIRNDRDLAHLKLILMTLSTHKISNDNFFDELLVKPITSDRLLQCLKLDRKQIIKDNHIFDNSFKILLVEDNPVNQTLAINQLKKLGLSVDLAPNGKEAIGLIKSTKYNLVLMDCQMPVMDGYTASQEIRRLEAERILLDKLPIVAMTASSLEADRNACLEAGMDDFISKPVTKNKLAEVLQKWLSQSRSVTSSPLDP